MVALQHLPRDHDFSLEGFQPKKKLKARLLWVDMAVKGVGLTLQKELVEGRAYDFKQVDIGDKFEG